MNFCTGLNMIYQQFGTSAFDGLKSLSMLADYSAFSLCNALQNIYKTFLINGGNYYIVDYIQGNISASKERNKRNAFLKAYGYRNDMVDYMFDSIADICNSKNKINEPYFKEPYNAYCKVKSSKRLLPIHFNIGLGFIGLAVVLVVLYFAIFNVDSEVFDEDCNAQVYPDVEKKTRVSEDIQIVEPVQETLQSDNARFIKNEGKNKIKSENASSKTDNPQTPLAKDNLSDDNLPEEIDDYLIAAEECLKDPKTHYLAEKYAKLALLNGQMDAKKVINQLKTLGYYD